MFTFIPTRDLPPPDDTVDQRGEAAIVFAGFPSDYSLGFLLALLRLDVHLVGIITSPGANPAILGDNALSRISDHLQIPLIRAWRINDEHSRMQLSHLHPHAVVMASFDQIVGHRALDIPRHGWMNIHPSLLPRYRGPEPVYWAIADGATETGITLHKAVPRFDSGPVLASAAVAIEPDDTSGTLTKRLVARGVALLPQALDALLHDDPGAPLDMSNASYRPPIGHRSLSQARSASEAERLVRAGVPNMLAWARVDGRDIYVREAVMVHNGTGPDGMVLTFPDGGLRITDASDACGCHHNVPDCPHRSSDVAAV
jgi:methionyl-tRNA formyltransferase